MSSIQFYRVRSATTINQLKPLQHVRSRSPDDVLQRQKVIEHRRATTSNIRQIFFFLLSIIGKFFHFLTIYYRDLPDIKTHFRCAISNENVFLHDLSFKVFTDIAADSKEKLNYFFCPCNSSYL